MKLTIDHPDTAKMLYELDYTNPYQVIKWYNGDQDN